MFNGFHEPRNIGPILNRSSDVPANIRSTPTPGALVLVHGPTVLLHGGAGVLGACILGPKEFLDDSF